MSRRIYSGDYNRVRGRRRNGRGVEEEGVGFEEVGMGFEEVGRGWRLYQQLAAVEEGGEKAQDRNCTRHENQGGRYRCCKCIRYYAAPCHAGEELGWSPHLEVCGRRHTILEVATSGSIA